jgi:hypothetical protein
MKKRKEETNNNNNKKSPIKRQPTIRIQRGLVNTINGSSRREIEIKREKRKQSQQTVYQNQEMKENKKRRKKETRNDPIYGMLAVSLLLLVDYPGGWILKNNSHYDL